MERGLPFGQRHILDQAAQQLFAFGVRGRRGAPDCWQVLCEGDNPRPLFRTDTAQHGLRAGGSLAPKAFDLGQLLVPVVLQTACHEAVFGLDGEKASTRRVGLILCPLQPQLPLAFDLTGSGLELIEGGQ
jgi:hypothetical protein